MGALDGKDGEGSRQIRQAAVFNLERKWRFGVAVDFKERDPRVFQGFVEDDFPLTVGSRDEGFS